MPDLRTDRNAEDNMIEDDNAARQATDEDPRSDIEQAVQARADAVARGEGGARRGIADAGEYSGVSGDGGEVKNQDVNAQ